MNATLQDRSIIITGAGGGIGSVAAQVFGKAGARLVVTDVNEDTGEKTRATIEAEGGQAIFIKADLASEEDIAALVAKAVKTYGRLDGAFNNAGVEQRNKPLTELTLEEWDRALRINLTATFLCLKHQINAMLKTGGGAIVNTASIAGQVSFPGIPEYSSTKAGVIGLTKSAAVEYGGRGVRVNAIMPGTIRTPMIERLMGNPDFANTIDHMRKRHVMDRFGDPDEVGEATAWLLSDAASFVNGVALAVDGGFLANGY